MGSDVLRIAMVGAGHMGQRHIAHISAGHEWQLVGVVDPRELADAIPAGIPHARDLSGTSDWAFDCAVVAVPTNRLFDVTAGLLERKKHVLVEKPLAATSIECEGLARLAAEAGVHLAVGYVERFNPAIVALGQHMADLGPLRRIATHRSGRRSPSSRSAGDVLFGLAVHDIDLVRTLAGELDLRDARLSPLADAAVIDTAQMRFAAADGVEVSVHVDWTGSDRVRTIDVHGTRGHAHCDLLAQSVVVELEDGRRTRRLADPPCHPLAFQLRQFGRLVRSNDRGNLAQARDAASVISTTEVARRWALGCMSAPWSTLTVSATT